MAEERCTFLDLEPFLGPETLADFTRGLKAVSALRANLLETVASKAAEVVALETELDRATSYAGTLKDSFNVCPAMMASTDFRVMQMKILDECTRTAADYKSELDDKLSAARSRLKELTACLFDMNEAVRLAEIEPRRPQGGFYAVIEAMRAFPELADITAAVEDLSRQADDGKCPICWERVSTHACVPCGHMFCETCATTLHACASCRGDVRQTIKVFF